MGKIKLQEILKNVLDKLQKLYIKFPQDIPAYPGMSLWSICLIHNIYKLFSMALVRFVEMNFEQFHQQSQPYAIRVPEKFSTL